MTFLASTRVDDTTLWTASGVDGDGDPTFAAPVAIKGKWDRKSGVIRGGDGEDRVTSHVVHLGQDVSAGDFLYQGTSVQANPRDEADALRVEDFIKVKSFNEQSTSRRALL